MRLHGVTLSLVCEACLLGVEFLAWSAEGTWRLGWMEGIYVAIEENEPEETRVSGVSRREDTTLNRGTYKRVREIYE